jgi:ABC-type antimicrobial peptide transport system permease subunit
LTAPLLGGFLVGVSPRDPLALVTTALVVLGTAMLAGAWPALPAARIDPMVSLKAQ